MKKMVFLLLGVLVVPLLCSGDIKRVRAEEEKAQTESTKPDEPPALSEVTVIGVGKNKEDALDKAFHKAVENVTGAWVWGYTEVNKGKLIEDKILVHVKGFVKDHEIIEDKTMPNGDIILTVKVKVDTTPIRNILRDAKIVTRDVIIGDLATIKQTQERLKRSKKVLMEYIGTDKAEFIYRITQGDIEMMNSTSLYSREDIKDIKERIKKKGKYPRVDQTNFVEKAYNFDYAGYEIDDIGLDSVRGNILVRISLNKPWWDGYWDVIKEISQENPKSVISVIHEGWLLDPSIYDGGMDGCITGNNKKYADPEGKLDGRRAELKAELDKKGLNFYYIHESLRPYLVPPILLKIKDQDIILYKNGYKLLKSLWYSNLIRERLSIRYINSCVSSVSEIRSESVIGEAYTLKLPFTFRNEKEVNNFISKLKLKYTIMDKGERSVVFL